MLQYWNVKLPTLLLKNLLLTRLSLSATLFIAHFGKIPIEMNMKCARVMTRASTGVHSNPYNLESNSHGHIKT